MSLTYESFDSKWLDLHIDKQATVCFYQGWSQSNGWLRITQFDDTIDNTVNKAKKKTQSSHTGLPLQYLSHMVTHATSKWFDREVRKKTAHLLRNWVNWNWANFASTRIHRLKAWLLQKIITVSHSSRAAIFTYSRVFPSLCSPWGKWETPRSLMFHRNYTVWSNRIAYISLNTACQR